MARFWLSLLIFGLSALIQAKPQLPAIFGDHMVLQRGRPLLVWGKADPGEAIAVSLAGKKVLGRADKEGHWAVTLPNVAGLGPYEMLVQGGETVFFQDVMIGEVWLASGQSNMEMALKQAQDAGTEIPRASDAMMRFFVVEKAAAGTPQDTVRGSWKVCDPASAADFSAAAYYFGKEIRAKIKAPVGLIGAYWGGTQAELWTPRVELEKDNVTEPLLRDWAINHGQDKPEEGYALDLQLADVRFVGKDGSGVLVNLGEPVAGKLGGGWGAWTQGRSHAETARDAGPGGKGESLRLTAKVQAGDWCNLVTRLGDENAPADLSSYTGLEFGARGRGTYFASLGQPSIRDWDYYSSVTFSPVADWKTFRFDLAQFKQQGWGRPEIFTPQALDRLAFNAMLPSVSMPSSLYNAMIAPLAGYGLRGAIWYQGEANVGRAGQYAGLLADLIRGWRSAFKQGDFPFYIVQLANIGPQQETPGESAWAELREAQYKASQVKNAGMAVAVDIGEGYNIHPKNKQEVGRRLSLLALARVYGQKIDDSGPVFASMKITNSLAALFFKHTGKGLEARGGELKGFAVAGKDGKFVWAKAEIKGDKVLVWSGQVAKPAAVRYAWGDNPECNLYNKDGLPAVPFRTDGK